MPIDEEVFINGLDLKPDDWGLRLVYADWLEERGRLDEAECQRWLVSRKKCPGRKYSLSRWSQLCWAWYRNNTPKIHSKHRLGSKLIVLMGCREVYCAIPFNTRQQAELALSKALVKYRAEAATRA